MASLFAPPKPPPPPPLPPIKQPDPLPLPEGDPERVRIANAETIRKRGAKGRESTKLSEETLGGGGAAGYG